jgi:hypothetical protein
MAIINKCIPVRFQVLTAASMKIRDVWDVAPCNLVEVYRRFRDAYCLQHQGVRPTSQKALILKYNPALYSDFRSYSQSLQANSGRALQH